MTTTDDAAREPARERILVAHQSGHGSTAEIAAEVGAVLARGGALVDVRAIADVDAIDGYDRIVVGGAIRYERWMRGATDFVRTHRARLADVPVALFFTCLALSDPRGAGRATAAGYERAIRAIAPEIEPVSVRGFAGVLDYSRMSPLTRLVARALLAFTPAKAGDHRDWAEIEAWARGLSSRARVVE